MRTNPIRAAALLAAVAAVGAGGGAATYAALSPDGQTTTVVRETTPSSEASSAEPAAATSSLSVSQIYRRVRNGVVEITVSTSSGSQFGGSETQRAQGSGFVYDADGHVVTNQHVVDGAASVSVRLSNGSAYPARVVGTDASTDLAVLDVDAPASLLAPLTLGDSSDLAVGDGVVAIGSPFGLEDTVTSGIVSALGRQISSPNGFAINDAVQTDAAINHGNSGGPLLDLRGRVIGVNAQIESDSGGNDGVGFAIPANTVRSVAEELISSGEVEHAYLGVSLESIPGDLAGQLGTVAGVAVATVRDGAPAQEAGLRPATGSQTVDGVPYPTGGDVITALDGEAVATPEDVQSAVDAKRPGDTVTVTYVRDGEERSVEVTLGTRPS